MNHRLTATLALAASLVAPRLAYCEAKKAGPMSDEVIDRQKHNVEESLQHRLADIEKRFGEEQSFRVKMKNDRVAFERKLSQDREAFLDGLKKVRAQERDQALSAYYGRLKEKRKEFNEQRRAASRQFWEARIAARTAQRPTAR